MTNTYYYPSYGSEDTEEKLMARWIGTRKQAKQGKGRSKFHNSDQKIVEEYGFSDLFEVVNRESDSNEMTHEVCKWIKENDRYPSEGAKGAEEKQMSQWVRTRRNARQGKGSGSIFYPSDQKITESYGFSDLFDLIDFEEKSNETTRQVCQWIKENDRFPDKRSKNPEEQRMGNWLGVRKQAKQNLSSYIFYPSDQKIAESYGFSDLFDLIDFEERSNETTHQVCQWVKNNKRQPINGSKDPEEKIMGRWLGVRKDAKQGKGTGYFYISDQKIAESHGCSDLFDRIDRESDSNEMAHKTCKWIKKNNGKFPNQRSKNKKEKQVAEWVKTRKKAKLGKGNCSMFYLSDQKIVESYGYSNLFEAINRELDSNEITHKVCKWIKKYKRYPSKRSKDPEEKRMGQWLGTRKTAKQGKGTSHFYLSDQQIVESYGYSDLFEVSDCKPNGVSE